MEGDINAELQYASPFMRGIIDLGHDMSTTGIDPSTAMVIVAAVPVTLRVLRMANELSSAAVSDWSEGKRLERKKQELDIEHKAHERKNRVGNQADSVQRNKRRADRSGRARHHTISNRGLTKCQHQ